MSKVTLPQAPDNYHYEVQRDWNKQYHAIWLVDEREYSYTTEQVKTIWGFLKKKTMQIYSPVNAKKVGKLATKVTPYSAMMPPLGASCISVYDLLPGAA